MLQHPADTDVARAATPQLFGGALTSTLLQTGGSALIDILNAWTSNDVVAWLSGRHCPPVG
jgi:hypothetical protein